MATADPLGVGNTVKPNTALFNSSVHSTWVVGESSSRGGTRLLEDVEVSAIVTPEYVPEDFDASTIGAPMMVACVSGYIGEAGTKGGMGATFLTPMSAVLSLGATVVPMGSGLEDSTHQRNWLVD